MSRRTLVALWLALMVGVGTWAWCTQHPDACARYLRGDGLQESTQDVALGKDAVAVPCGVWLPRQRPEVQMAVALGMILTLMFCVNAWEDARRAAARRRALEDAGLL